ncbi:MAG: hypothetical protein PHG66_00650 [Candidatus Colwellbacteria bacterium]|nr:hypothetical protein [Candidatus Colwellbacteria bacterium]
MSKVSLRIGGDLYLNTIVDDPYTFMTNLSQPSTIDRDIELVITGVSMNDGDRIRHEKVQITDNHSLLTMKSNDMDTLFTVCRVYLYLKEGKYDKENIEEIRLTVKEIARMEFDYVTRKAMANLIDENLFSQLEGEFCYSRYKVFDIKWGDEQNQIDNFKKTIPTDYLIASDIFLSVKREKAELFLSFLLTTHTKILVILPNRTFNKFMKKEFRSSSNLWEPARDEFLDFINSCIRGKGFNMKFSCIGDRVNDEPMYFSAMLKKE